jgi:hypothetical protein
MIAQVIVLYRLITDTQVETCRYQCPEIVCAALCWANDEVKCEVEILRIDHGEFDMSCPLCVDGSCTGRCEDEEKEKKDKKKRKKKDKKKGKKKDGKKAKKKSRKKKGKKKSK